jgi:hypothetical protein
MQRTVATGAVGGFHLDRVPGVSAGSLGIATDRNNWQEEICSAIEGIGVTLDGADWMQLEKVIIAGQTVGSVVDSMVKETPVTWQNARCKLHTAYPRYNPLIPVFDADHDLAAAQVPLLVTKLRAHKAEALVSVGPPTTWLTDHSVTVSAHVVTGSGAAWDNLLAELAEDQLVETAANTIAGGFGYGKAAYTNWRCLNVAGVDYVITNVNPGAHTVTITGDSLSGAQTAIWYPYRIAGSATSIRLFQDAGRATVSHGTSECIGGGRRRDRTEGHRHNLMETGGTQYAGISSTACGSGSGASVPLVSSGTYIRVGDALTDGTNGTPRVGGTTDPRATVIYRYVFAGVLLN